MKRTDRKTPVFRMVAYAIMIIGILLFFLTPLFIKVFDLDTDIMGILLVLVGLAVLSVGTAVRRAARKRRNR